jgi:hypothetical protein
MSDHGKCMCSSDDCRSIQKGIQELASQDDVWCGSCFRIDYVKSMGAKRAATRQCIMHHLPSFKTSGTKKFYIARHHYPRELLEYTLKTKGWKQMTSLLNETEMSFIAKRDGKSRLLERCNKVAVLLSKIETGPDPQTTNLDKLDTFVAPPVGTMEEASSFLTLLNSSRSQRLQKRKTSEITPSTGDEKSSEPQSKKTRETPELPFVTNSHLAPYSPVLMNSLEHIGTGASLERGRKNKIIASPLFGAYR